jgi:hypothetical protein
MHQRGIEPQLAVLTNITAFCRRVDHTPSVLSALLKMVDRMVDKFVLNFADNAHHEHW